ncbi:MAG: lysylphosphatidylglycerol synthase transmembrane domain-containing protein [Cyanobacteria bacterium P01_A01_bin.17]
MGLVIALDRLRFDGEAFLQTLRQFGPASLGTGLVIVIVQIAFQISRLWVLCPPTVGVSWRQAAHSFVSGQFVSNFIQGQAGHAVKVAVLRQPENAQGRQMAAAESTAIVFVDKVMDILMLLGLTGLAVLQLGLLEQGWRYFDHHLLWGIPVVAVAISLLIYALCRCSGRIRRGLADFQKGLAVVRSPIQLGQGMTMGVGDWSSECILLQVLCIAQGFPLSPAQLMVSLFILNVGISIPISVANVGTFEAALIFALTRFGVPLVQGVAIATLFHLYQMIGIALWVLVMLPKNVKAEMQG